MRKNSLFYKTVLLYWWMFFELKKKYVRLKFSGLFLSSHVNASRSVIKITTMTITEKDFNSMSKNTLLV